MKRPTRATTLLLALSAWALSVPRLANAAVCDPELTGIHRVALLAFLVLAFALGCLIVKRVRRDRMVGPLAYASGFNLLAIGLMWLVTIPGNEDIWQELVCRGFLWICVPYTVLRDDPQPDLIDLFLAPAVSFGIAFLIALVELSAVHLFRVLRGRWAASRSS